MKRKLIFSITFLFLTFIYGDIGVNSNMSVMAADSIMSNYRFLDHEGKSHELYYYDDNKAIVLIWQGNGCPIVRLSYNEINKLKKEFTPLGVEFFYVNANSQDDVSSIKEEADNYQLDIPILKDDTQILTTDLGVNRTATAVLVNPKNWKILYQGPIDDRLGYESQKDKAKHRYLYNAIQLLLDDQPVDIDATTVKGCLINLNAFGLDQKITYSKDVAPILLKNCYSCHYKGGVAPFSFNDYKSVRGWAPMIKEVIQTKRMPPWKVDPKYGPFKYDMSLTDKESRTIIEWIRGGMLKGDDQDVLKNESKNETREWQLGKPDIILTSEWQDIPAKGLIPYFYSSSQELIEDDIWIEAIEFKPSNPKVVHHFAMFDVEPEALEGYEFKSGHKPEHNLRNFAGYAPGRRVIQFAEGTGVFLRKNTRLAFMSHYITSGKKEKNQFEVGFYLSKKKILKRLFDDTFHNTGFYGSAYEKDVYVTHATSRLAQDITVYGYYPHMHYHGKSMRFIAQFPDGKKETIFSIPDFDFQWQHYYYLEKPRVLKKGTKIIFDGYLDNSLQNKEISDPSKIVRWGRGPEDAMFSGTLFFVKEDEQKRAFNSKKVLLQEYYPNNQLKRKEVYLNGKKHGVIKRFDSKGNLIYEREYRFGRLIEDGQPVNGIRKTYFRNGTLFSVENFKDGRADGISKYYNGKGIVLAEFDYANGEYLYTNEYDANGNFIERNMRRFIHPKNKIPNIVKEIIND